LLRDRGGRDRRRVRSDRPAVWTGRRWRDVVHVLMQDGCRDLAGRDVERLLVRRLLLRIVGGDLVGVALLPAGLALRELLLELAAVEEDELGQLARPSGRDHPS